MILWASQGLGERLTVGDEQSAREELANKLLKLSRSLDMKEAAEPTSKGEGGKDYNSNDGNSFTSNTTYHSNVWSRCLEWIGGQFCNRWLDPFVSPHGFGADKSPLEAIVGQAWQNRKVDEDVGGTNYAIWEVNRIGGGSNLDVDGKFDRKGLIDWRLQDDVRKAVEKVGSDTAIRQISLTYDDNTGKGQNTMPNIESLRVMASRWTKMMRNRLVTNIGESRAMKPGIEFALGEEIPDCESYLTAVENDQDLVLIEERIQAQGSLAPATLANSLQQRYESCVKLRNASVYAVNASYQDGEVSQGDPNDEAIDEWKSRLNIAAIDFAGIDPNELPKPGAGVLKEEDLSTEMRDYAEGGLTYEMVRKTPREQLDSYNKNLEEAAAGMEAVTSRSGVIVDNSDRIREFKIEAGKMNAIRINDITPEMRQELAVTPFPANREPASDPSLNLEQTPSTLSINARE